MGSTDIGVSDFLFFVPHLCHNWITASHSSMGWLIIHHISLLNEFVTLTVIEGLCGRKECTVCTYFVVAFQIAWNPLKFGMPTLFVFKICLYFFSTSGETRLQTHSWKSTPLSLDNGFPPRRWVKTLSRDRTWNFFLLDGRTSRPTVQFY